MNKEIKEMLNTLKTYYSILTKQEYKTIKGCVKDGKKGLITLLNRKLISR